MTFPCDLQKPVKGVRSTYKICQHLFQSKLFFDYSKNFLQRLDEVKLVGWDFESAGYDFTDDPMQKKNVPLPDFCMLIDYGGESNVQRVSYIQGWTLEFSRLCKEESLNDILHALWGTKECPTYFCKKDTLLAPKKSKSDSSNDIWANFARDYLTKNDEHASKIRDTEIRIISDMQAALSSSEFVRERVEHHERFIIEDIKKVLIKYSPVLKQGMLKTALDEFIVHEISES